MSIAGKSPAESERVEQVKQVDQAAPTDRKAWPAPGISRTHRVRAGNGRRWWQRMLALPTLLLLVGVLGLLLAGLVVGAIVVAVFLLETLIG